MRETLLEARVAELEAELATMIRVVKMVQKMPEFEVDNAKSLRRGSKNRRRENINESLGLYASCAEKTLGRKVER